MATLIGSIAAALLLVAQPGEQYKLILNVIKVLMTWNQSSGAISFIDTLYSYMEVPAMTLVVCYMLMEIFSVVQRQGSLSNVGPDVVVLPLVKAAVCMYLIQQLPTLMGSVLGASNSLYDSISGTIDADMTGNLAVSALDSKSGILAKIFFELVPSFLSLIGQVIACIAIVMQIVTIRLDILLRYIFLPFAVASIAHGGPQSGGMHYLKRFIGNFVLMAAIAVSIRITFLMCMDISLTAADFKSNGDVGGAAIAAIMGFLITSVVGPFAAVGAVSAVKSVVGEAFS